MSNHQVKVFSSIQFKVIVVTVATITMIFGCFAVVDNFIKHSRVQDEMIQATDIAARRLAENQKIPLWDLNQELAKAVLLVEMQVADVYALAVYEYTKDGERLFSGIQRAADWSIGGFNGNMPEGLVKQIKQIETKGEKLGRVEVYLSPRLKNAELSRNTLNAIIALVVLDIGIIAVLWLVLRSILIDPITHLSDVAEKISLGKFGQKLQFNTRNDEIGLLARAIGRMETSLDMAVSRLNKLRPVEKG